MLLGSLHMHCQAQRLLALRLAVHMEAAQKHWILPWKGLEFRAPGQQNPSKIDFQTHKNVKVGAKSSGETSREAVETDFGPQDNGFGSQEGDFGGQNGGPSFYMRPKKITQRNAQGL